MSQEGNLSLDKVFEFLANGDPMDIVQVILKFKTQIQDNPVIRARINHESEGKIPVSEHELRDIAKNLQRMAIEDNTKLEQGENYLRLQDGNSSVNKVNEFLTNTRPSAIMLVFLDFQAQVEYSEVMTDRINRVTNGKIPISEQEVLQIVKYVKSNIIKYLKTRKKEKEIKEEKEKHQTRKGDNELMISQITLDPKTKEILDLVAPEWTKLLASVNFDGKNFRQNLKNQMNLEKRSCLIGEIHSKDRKYGGCNVCRCLALLSPYVFGTMENDILAWDSLLNSLLNDGFKFETSHKYRNHVKVDQFLDGIVRHMEKSHKKILVDKITS